MTIKRWTWLVPMLTVAACGRGNIITSTSLLPPSLVAPSITNQENLPVTGTRSPNSSVWVTFTGGQATQIAPAANSASWSGMLTLPTEGVNTFTLTGKEGSSSSKPSLAYQIVLDTVPPSPPTVNAPSAVFLDGQTSVQATVTGTHDPDSSVQVNGTTVFQSNGDQAFSTQVTVVDGNNTYTFTAQDAAGNISQPTLANIYGTNIPAPTINATSWRTPTNQPNQHLVGTKPPMGPLYLVLDGGPPINVGNDILSTWDYAFNLGADGTHTVSVYVIATDNEISPTTSISMVLKTTIPDGPTGIQPTPFDPMPDTGNANITITATIPAGTYLCISNTQQGNCIQVIQPDGSLVTPTASTGVGGSVAGGTVSENIPLAPGDNPLFVSARDDAGNISPETPGDVYRVSPPVISGWSPTDGTVITGTTLPVSITVTANPNDAGHTGATLATVEACLDGICENLTSSGGSTYSNSGFDISNFINGSTHVLSFDASNSLTATASSGLLHLHFSNGQPYAVSNDQYPAVLPKMARASSGVLHVVWQDYCAQGGSSTCNNDPVGPILPDIFYTSQVTEGVWTPVQLVSAADANDGISLQPSIALDSTGKVHVVWRDNGSVGGKPSSYGVLHRVYNGSTWSSIAVVGQPSNGIDDVAPSIAADASGGMHAVWSRTTSGSRRDIEYAYYNGSTWTPPLQVTPTSDANVGIAEAPTVAVANGTAWVAWQECRVVTNGSGTINYCGNTDPNTPNHDIWLRQISNPTTLAGSAPLLITDQSKDLGYDGDSLQPSMVADANNMLWMFWQDTGTLHAQTRQNIWLRTYQSTTGLSGLTVVSDDPSFTLASENPSAYIGPTQANNDAAIAVAWTQNLTSTNSDIWAKSGTVSGNLGSAASVYTTPERSTSPTLAVDANSKLQVVWDDTSSFSGGVNSNQVDQIFYQRTF